MFKRYAILIIHGFAGGTYDEENLANYLELNKYYDVYQFTLPGHDRNLSKSTKEDWINKSEEKLNYLINNGYNNIYLIGHSMGGVIATYLAAKYKQVKKLVLAAPSFQYINSVKETPKVVDTYGKEEIISRFLKLNVTTLNEFTNLVKEYYDYPKQVTCPTMIIQGKNDNLVPLSSSKYVYDNINTKDKKLVYIDNLTHDVFRSNKDDIVFKLVKDYLKHIDRGIYNI